MADDEESTCSNTCTHTACATSNTCSDNQEDEKKLSHKKARKWVYVFLVVGAIAAAIIGIIVTIVILTRRTSTTTSSSSSSSSSNTNSSYNESTSIYFDNEHFVFVEPFQVRPLLPFDQRVLQPYKTREELEEDLENFAKILVNGWIAEYLDIQVWPDQQKVTFASASAKAAAAQTNKAIQQQQQQQQQPSLTNNQEKNADEADILKNDDNYVYAASGSYLVVWDRRRGRMVAQDRMPRHTHPQDYVSNFVSIKAIQLTKNHVVVIAGEIGIDYTVNSSVVQRNNYQVRVYTKPKYNPAYDQANVTTATTTLPLVATKLLHGYYIASHYLEASDSVHITMAGEIETLDMRSSLLPSSIIGQTRGSKALYVQEATKTAKEWLIPNFVQGIADDFWSPSGSFMRMSSFLLSSESGMDDLWRIGGYLQVTSFLAKDLPVEEGSLTTSTTSLLTPSANSYSYAVDNSMVVAVNHWYQEHDRTALIHLKVDANTSTAHFFSLASLEGNLPWPSMRSVDLLGNILRVVMTETLWVPYNVANEECGWPNDPSIGVHPCVNETNWQQCYDLVNTEYCKTLVKTGCPYEFACDEDEDEVTSTTNNHVVVLDTTQPGEMVERGRVHIGEPHQRITAVHFGETSAYIMTRNKHSTFYTLKLDVGGVPEVQGSLHGLERVFFYLCPLNDYPLNEQATRLLGLGHKVVGSGQNEMWTGLMVSILDVSNQTDPVIVSDILIEGVRSDISRYDLKPVQYKDGILVLPIFDSATGTGMLVIVKVQEEGVFELFWFNIGQGAPQNGCSSCWSSLPVRSLFFDDDTLMGMSQNTVVSMDPATGEELWSFDVVFNGTGNCCQK